MTSSAHRPHWRALALAGLLALTLALTWADGAMAATDAGPGAARDDDGGTPRTRILGRIDEKDRVTLTGNA